MKADSLGKQVQKGKAIIRKQKAGDLQIDRQADKQSEHLSWALR